MEFLKVQAADQFEDVDQCKSQVQPSDSVLHNDACSTCLPASDADLKEDQDIDLDNWEDDEDGCVSLWVMTTDAGSDIHGARNLLKRFAEEEYDTWFVDCDCFAHQYDLITRDILMAMEDIFIPAFESLFDDNFKSFRYYSSLACVMHIIRDNLGDLFSAWVGSFLPKSAVDHGLHRCPQPQVFWKPGKARQGRRACRRRKLW